MRSSLVVVSLLNVLTPVFAGTGGGIPWEPESEFIPEVAGTMEQLRQHYAPWFNYKGPPKGQSQPPHSPRPLVTPQPASCSFWLENITHQGVAPYAGAGYQVFRNVKDPQYGAKGDGVTDDTAAIQAAIADGGRCEPGPCQSNTTTPALVYFPYGIYMVNTSIIDYYYTQLYGNPNCLPTIRAFSTFTPLQANNGQNFSSVGLIDGDPTYNGNKYPVNPTNIFWRSIRNFVVDMTLVNPQNALVGINWPTAQATSITNVVFQMSSAANTQQIGLMIGSGSGGFVSDLVFNGGYQAAVFGNQQFTMRNLTFNNAQTAISQTNDWGWTYQQLSINNCSLGIQMTRTYNGGPSVGSVIIIDSNVANTPIFVQELWDQAGEKYPAANSLVIENTYVQNVPIVVQNSGKTMLTDSPPAINYVQGHYYTPNGPNTTAGTFAFTRSSALTAGGSFGNYYTQRKPTYASTPVSGFISARSSGAKGDGVTDDTKALQSAITNAAKQSKVLFVDAGYYVVSKTITIPPGSQIVGEAFPVILSSGKFFNNIKKPQPVVKIGSAGQTGTIAWSDMIVSTRGQQQGAILLEYNLQSPSGSPSGLWDVHARIGGFTGSNLSYANCGTLATPTSQVNSACIAAFLTFYVTSAATGLYMENNWLWTADHDVDDPALRQITVFNGRGLYITSTAGPIWLVGTAVEHHTLYQYEFSGASTVYAGFIQTETPYYQPTPSAPTPWPYNAAYGDPKFPSQTINATDGYNNIPAADAWGLRILNSNSIYIYGAGLYSFFKSNNPNVCNKATQGDTCQSAVVSLEGTSHTIGIYALSTVGTHYMISINGTYNAEYLWSENQSVFPDTIVVFASDSSVSSYL